MKRLTGFAVAVALAFMVWACASAPPGPGEPGYAFNLSGVYNGDIVVDGMPFGSSLDIQTRAGGTLEGTYEVKDPVNMKGTVSGTIVADSVAFTLNYMNPMDGCGGVLDGTGTVDEGGEAFSGRARVNDSCGGYLSGSFSFRK